MILCLLLLSLIINFLSCKSDINPWDGRRYLYPRIKDLEEMSKEFCIKYDCPGSFRSCNSACPKSSPEVFYPCHNLCVDELENCKRLCLTNSDLHRRRALKYNNLLEEGLLTYPN